MAPTSQSPTWHAMSEGPSAAKRKGGAPRAVRRGASGAPTQPTRSRSSLRPTPKKIAATIPNPALQGKEREPAASWARHEEAPRVAACTRAPVSQPPAQPQPRGAPARAGLPRRQLRNGGQVVWPRDNVQRSCASGSAQVSRRRAWVRRGSAQQRNAARQAGCAAELMRTRTHAEAEAQQQRRAGMLQLRQGRLHGRRREGAGYERHKSRHATTVCQQTTSKNR